MKFSNPFKRKKDPEMDSAYEARKQATTNKLNMAERIIDQMNALKKSQNVDRRIHVLPVDFDRRKAHG